MRNTPYTATQQVNADLGIYAQDAWTMKRLTLNYGGRFDHFNSSVPAHTSPPTIWLPFVRDFAAIENVPNWNDWAIRLAGSYDLFGTGKTALKGNISKYMASEAASLRRDVQPDGPVATETRRWTDLDSNRTIYDANGNIQYNEVAAGSANFGQAGAAPTPDPGLKRGYNWEYLGVGAARADAEGVDYRRLLLPKIRQPAHQRQPQPEPTRIGTPFTIVGPTNDLFPTGGGETITMYSLNQTASRTTRRF